MALSLFDHEQRLHDLELAVDVLLEAVSGADPETAKAVRRAASKLRAWGEDGAADLLTRAAAHRACVR